MYLAQTVEVKGDINLEAVHVYSAGMGGPMGGSMGGQMGFPNMGVNMSFGQPSFGGGFNPGFGFPSAPPVVSVTSFPVRFSFFYKFLSHQSNIDGWW
jgi:hypothetical protein